MPLSYTFRNFAKARHGLGILGLLSSAVGACNEPVGSVGGGGPAVVASVKVSPAADTLVAIGETLRLTATALDAEGMSISGKTFFWTTSDGAIVAVDSTGLATAVADGSATITATADGVMGPAVLHVMQVVVTVHVLPLADTLVAVGDTVQLVATAQDANGQGVAGATFSWASSDVAVALVSASGLVTAVGEGFATITVKVDSINETASILVSQATDPTGSLTVITATSGEQIDSNGYLVAVDDTSEQRVTANDTVTYSQLAVSDHTVELRDIAENCALGSENPQTVRVVADGESMASFSVDCESPPSLSLRSDFGGIEGWGPDLAIAVGTSSMVLLRNNDIVIRTKTGALTASGSTYDFFTPVRDPEAGVGDPEALYDPGSGRFFVVEASDVQHENSRYVLAVSRTSDPTDLTASSWYFYSLDRTLDNDVPTDNWGDFDHLTATDDALVITSSMYGRDGSAQGVKVRILDKGRLVRGEPVTTWIDLRDEAFGGSLRLLPATQFPPSNTVFLVGTTSSCGFVIWRMTNLLTAPALSSAVVEDRGSCQSPPDAIQPSGAPPIDVTSVGFNSQPVYQNGSLWVANTISTDFAGGPVAAVYVAEIDVSQWPSGVQTRQSSVLGEDGVWQFAPALMVDGANNLALVYARSSATQFASAYYSGRLAMDPPDLHRMPRPLRSGESIVSLVDGNRNRFTDYFGAALDPSDDSIWLLGMYAVTPQTTAGWVGNLDLAAQALFPVAVRRPH